MVPFVFDVPAKISLKRRGMGQVLSAPQSRLFRIP
jgi:hypothetical protein